MKKIVIILFLFVPLTIFAQIVYPETKKGQAQALAMNKAQGYDVTEKNAVTSFAKDTAQQTGLSDRTIRQKVANAYKTPRTSAYKNGVDYASSKQR